MWPHAVHEVYGGQCPRDDSGVVRYDHTAHALHPIIHNHFTQIRVVYLTTDTFEPVRTPQKDTGNDRRAPKNIAKSLLTVVMDNSAKASCWVSLEGGYVRGAKGGLGSLPGPQ